MRLLSRLLWLFLAVYLLSGAAALGIALADTTQFKGVLLVFLAMPWTLLADPVLGALETRSLPAACTFFGLGILINAAVIFWAARFLSRG